MDSIEHFDRCLGWAKCIQLCFQQIRGVRSCQKALGGQLLDAVAKRDSEDWLLAITTDHGGGMVMGLIAFVLVVDHAGIDDALRFHPRLFCFT